MHLRREQNNKLYIETTLSRPRRKQNAFLHRKPEFMWWRRAFNDDCDDVECDVNIASRRPMYGYGV